LKLRKWVLWMLLLEQKSLALAAGNLPHLQSLILKASRGVNLKNLRTEISGFPIFD